MDVSASLTGPTGSIDLGYGSANSEEGITVVMAEAKHHDRRRRREVMHSLHAGKSGMLWSSFFGHADQMVGLCTGGQLGGRASVSYCAGDRPSFECNRVLL
ncbi:DUF3277 family protein [Klebsiella pneumoniae]|nr:DUF3277 family protein [Klebsiella pneumoniae]